MRTAFVIAALAIVTILAPLATAHHGGWNCKGVSGVAQVCVAKTLSSGPDCVFRYDVNIRNDAIQTSDTWCIA